MKSLLLLPLLLVLSAPSQAQQVTEFCEQTQHREVYTPGYHDGYGNYIQGRVRTESYKVGCRNTSAQHYYQQEPQKRSCRPTSALLGALIGGGVAAGVSKSDAYGWSVPLGGVGGALLGCSL